MIVILCFNDNKVGANAAGVSYLHWQWDFNYRDIIWPEDEDNYRFTMHVLCIFTNCFTMSYLFSSIMQYFPIIHLLFQKKTFDYGIKLK